MSDLLLTIPGLAKILLRDTECVEFAEDFCDQLKHEIRKQFEQDRVPKDANLTQKERGSARASLCINGTWTPVGTPDPVSV